MAKKKVQLCLLCDKPLKCGSCRGVCTFHYAQLSRLVRMGKTTWDLLETAGTVLKPGKRQDGRGR